MNPASSSSSSKIDWGHGHWRFEEANSRAKALIPRFRMSKTLEEEVISNGGISGKMKLVIAARLPRFYLHPWFFGLYTVFFATIFLAFSAKIDRTKNGMDLNNRTTPGKWLGVSHSYMEDTGRRSSQFRHNTTCPVQLSLP
jgi:hypothetical protein